MFKKGNKYYEKQTWQEEIDLAFAMFMSFHDWYKQGSKRKNDKCLENLAEKVKFIASNKGKFNKTVELTELTEKNWNGITDDVTVGHLDKKEPEDIFPKEVERTK